MTPLRALLLAFLAAIILPGCDTMDPDAPARAQMNAAIAQEQPGNYYIGRRFYKKDYKMWGWVRQPGQPWTSAKLVMFNEQKVLAPDRQQGTLGVDNNYEYKLFGYYSGDTVYEPASDGFYPEFVLTGYEVKSTDNPSIYKWKQEEDPTVRILLPPVY